MVKFKPVQIKKRGISYQLYYYNPNSERRRLSVGKDYQHTQRLAVRFTDWLLEGKDPEQELSKVHSHKITLAELYPIFMERHGSHQSKSMQEIYRNRYKSISRCPDLTDIPICNITKKLVLDYMHLRMKQDRASTGTVNREAAMLKCMLFRATEWDMIDRNPLQGLRLFKESEKRKVNLTPEQAGRLISELSEPLANMAEFSIYSGFRKENVLSLRIEQIRFHDLTPSGEVDLTVKGGRHETFPLGKNAVEVLKRVIGERKDGYVFINQKTCTRYKSINRSFDSAVRKLGLTVNGTKFRWHDLRHVFCNSLLKEGVSIDIIRELAGHKNRATTDRYSSLERTEVGKYLSLIPKIKCPDRQKAGAI